MARKKPNSAASRQSAADSAVEVRLDRLLGALPEQSDLVLLRHALLRASIHDATHAWSRAGTYATFDKRVLSAGTLAQVVAEAKQAEHARVDMLYDALAAVLASVAHGDDTAAGLQLITLGESAEGLEDLKTAAAFYSTAVTFSAGLPDRSVRILALRRLGRAYLGMGDTENATMCYRGSLEQAATAADVAGQVIALIGMGNVLHIQGRWSDGITHYRSALLLCKDGFPQQRGQIAINLSLMLRELGDLDGAAAQLEAALELWSDLSRADQAGWYNYRGLLALARGDFDAAETNLRQAFETAETEFNRSMVLDNLAELFIQQGRLSEAESCGRAAEELALRAGSPRALAEIYTRLGKIFRLRADLNGVTFFEKALELCRGRSYPFIEANAYLEYGLFRRIHGDTEEARSYLERALELCAEIGASQLERATRDQLAQI